MLNYFDKAGFNLIAGGVLGQFFDSAGDDTRVLGCQAIHNATGNWTIVLPQPISKPNYLFLTGVLTGFTPGICVKMTDETTTRKFIQITNTSTGDSVDCDVSFMLFEIPPPATS